MQQFVVPQFIDVEDKIIGPITTRQFLIMLVGFLVIGVSYKIFDFSLFITVGIIVILLTGVFAFLRINGRPFHFFILNLFQTFRRPKLRVWYHDSSMEEDNYGVEETVPASAGKPVPEKHYTASRLAELSLVVDTKGAYRGEPAEEASDVKIKKVGYNKL